MGRFDAFMERGASVASLLARAGMDESVVRSDRAFASNWAWDDGRAAYATIWLHDILDPEGIPKWSSTDPRGRTDLAGQRRKRAQELFDILVRRVGEPVHVLLVELKPDPAQRASGLARSRGLDPEPWFAVVEGDTVLLQRSFPPGRKDVAVGGEPMPSRPPSLALRETRPEQVRFRERVAAKSGNRCALTGAPPEVCDAAHFPWANWRTDNEAKHGALLRRDLHAALDCGLIEIERSGLVLVSQYLATTSGEYRELHGREVEIGDDANA